MSSKDERTGEDGWFSGGTQVSPAWLGPAHFKPGCSGSSCRGWLLTPATLGEFLSLGRRDTNLPYIQKWLKQGGLALGRGAPDHGSPN